MRVVIPAEGGSARRDRLLRELRRAAQLTHESFARVLEVGTTESGDVFVEVEETEGERLSERLRRDAPFDERIAAIIATQVARALAAAHEAGVVHRALRPSVIVLVGEGDTTRVKVEGLAMPRLAAPGADDPEAAYAAPEQVGGGSVGRRADVYSIGAMLYAMLTGEAPTYPLAAPIESALGDVVRRCLAEDPRERFLDTVALSAALRAAVAPASERPPPVSQRPVSSPAISARPAASVGPPATPPPTLGRAPAAPPPRPLGRPLAARPPWEEALRDLGDGPLPRVALTTVVAFVIARILTSGFVPFVVAVAAGVAAYAMNYFRKSRADHSGR